MNIVKFWLIQSSVSRRQCHAPETVRTKMSRYLVIIEKTAMGFSAYSPDLAGCVATRRTRKEVEKEMHDAIEFHIEGLRLAGEDIPEPQSHASYCDVGV